jgi:hypothetical protein
VYMFFALDKMMPMHYYNAPSGYTPRKEVLNAQSVGLKKLAKVNTKGMKSLSSFFGAGTKKVKK